MKDAIRLAEHFSKQRDEVFADSIEKPLKTACSSWCRQSTCCKKNVCMLSLFIESTTEFKSIWVIKLKHLFAEGKGEIDE